jgi:hypothetical protein
MGEELKRCVTTVKRCPIPCEEVGTAGGIREVQGPMLTGNRGPFVGKVSGTMSPRATRHSSVVS